MLAAVQLGMTKSEVSPTQRMLNVWAIILIIWSFYRTTFQTTLPLWFDEFIAKPFVFLVPLYIFITKFKKTPFCETLGFTKKHKLTDILFGLGIGSFFVVMALLVRMMRGGAFAVPSVSATTLIWIGASITAATLEQILSTGFIFNGFFKESKNVPQSLLISAILFSFLHVPALFSVDKINGMVLMQTMILNIVLSLTTSTAFLMKKNTTVPIIIHALYLLSLPILL